MSKGQWLWVTHFEPVIFRPQALYDDLRLTLLKVGQDQIPAMNFDRKLGRGIHGAERIFANQRSRWVCLKMGDFTPCAILPGKAEKVTIITGILVSPIFRQTQIAAV